MLHPVDQMTWVWGLWGIAALAVSLLRRERIGIELGAVMFSTWGVATWALMWFDPERAFYVTTAYDGICGLMIALWMTHFGSSRRGTWIVALFAGEMLVRLPAASQGWWIENFCYDATCAIYGLQVAIGGWRGFMDTVTDWCAAFRSRRRLSPRGH